MNSTTRRLFAGALALTLVAAACGSDDDSSEETGDTSAPTEETGSASGTLIGAGASSQAAGMQGWQAGFFRHRRYIIQRPHTVKSTEQRPQRR